MAFVNHIANQVIGACLSGYLVYCQACETPVKALRSTANFPHAAHTRRFPTHAVADKHPR